GQIAAAPCADFDDVLRKGFGKTRQGPRQHPQPGVVPERQVAGDDVTHHALRNDGVCLGEHRAVGQQISLRGMAAMRRIVSPGHVNSTSRRCDPSPGAVGGHPERMPHLNGRLLYLPIKYWNSHYPFFKWMEI